MALFWKNILVFGACVGTYNFAFADDIEEAKPRAGAADPIEATGANGELNPEAGEEGAEVMPPNLKVLESVDDLTAELEKRTGPMALYVFEGGEEAFELAKFLAANPSLFANIVHINAEGESKLTVYKGKDEVTVYEGAFTHPPDVMQWARENRIPKFGEIGGENFEIYVESARKGLMWACFDPKTKDADVEKYTPAFVQAAGNQSEEEKYPFVWLDINQFGEHAKKELGCEKYPTVVLQRGDLMSETPDENPIEKFIRPFDATPSLLEKSETIDQFFADIKSGELKAEPIPDPLDALDDDDDDEDSSEGKEVDPENISDEELDAMDEEL